MLASRCLTILAMAHAAASFRSSAPHGGQRWRAPSSSRTAAAGGDLGFRLDAAAAVGPLVVGSSLLWLQVKANAFNRVQEERTAEARVLRRARVLQLNNEATEEDVQASLRKIQELTERMEGIRTVSVGGVSFRFNFPTQELDLVSLPKMPPRPSPEAAAEGDGAGAGEPWQNSLTDWVGDEEEAAESKTPKWLKEAWIRNVVLGGVAVVQLVLLALISTDPVGPPTPGGPLETVLRDLGERVDKMEESSRDRRATASNVRPAERSQLEKEYNAMMEREREALRSSQN